MATLINRLKAIWSERNFAQKTLLIYGLVLFVIYHAIYVSAVWSANGCVPDVVGCHKPIEFYALLVFVLLALSLYDIDVVVSNHAEIGNLFMQNILMDCFVLWLIAIPVFLLVRYVYQNAK